MKTYLILLLVTVAGCTSEWTVDLSNVNSVNNPIIQPTIQYADWTSVSQGIDFKQMFVDDELFNIVRIDPRQTKVFVTVDETAPKTVGEWREQLDAAVVINGGYFDEQYSLVSRTMTDGTAIGPLLSGETGVFTQYQGEWIITTDPALLTTTGIQSYPVLVKNGEANVASASQDTAQRSVVATDANGLVYLIVCEYGVFTLTELSAALAELSDPVIVSALNLDGGTSTGLSIQSQTVSYLDDSLVVPSVIVL